MGSFDRCGFGWNISWGPPPNHDAWNLFWRILGPSLRWLYRDFLYLVFAHCWWRLIVDWYRAVHEVGALFHYFLCLLGRGDFSACSALLYRGDSKCVTSLATVLEVGAVAASLVLKPASGCIMDIARGYPFYPNGGGVVGLGVPLPTPLVVSLVWTAAAVLVAAAIGYYDGDFRRLDLGAMFRHAYSPVSTRDNGEALKRSALKDAVRDAPPVPDAFNMFDPADLPPRLAEYANMVYSACEDLGNFFGFQDSSVRNQAEHLLILLSNNRRYMSSHILPPSVQPPSPIHALHAKVFSNYVKWCRAMGVPPHFSKMNASMSAPPAVASRVVDLVLYFCIWGEGCNLRHMPECTWFLYHKMMEEYIKSEGYTQTRSLYAGHFLDNVVTPIYEIVGKVRTYRDAVVSIPTGDSNMPHGLIYRT